MTSPLPRFRILPRPWQPVVAEVGDVGPYTCACCALLTTGARFSWHDAHGTLPVVVCPVCDLLQNLNRPGIESEAALIWWPENTQADLMTLTRMAHQTLLASISGQADKDRALWQRVVMALNTETEPGPLPVAARGPLAILRALRARSEEARRRLLTTSPRHLATALLMADTTQFQVAENVAALWQGLRLLPLGHLYAGATDIYPSLLRAWLTAEA